MVEWTYRGSVSEIGYRTRSFGNMKNILWSSFDPTETKIPILAEPQEMDWRNSFQESAKHTTANSTAAPEQPLDQIVPILKFNSEYEIPAREPKFLIRMTEENHWQSIFFVWKSYPI